MIYDLNPQDPAVENKREHGKEIATESTHHIDDVNEQSLLSQEVVASEEKLSPAADLTAQERHDYERHLARFKGIQDQWLEASTILVAIKEGRLYRENYPTFEAFCRSEFGMGKSNANRLVRSGEVATLLATSVAKPQFEAHIRPLLGLDDADQQVHAYRQAIELAEADHKPLTATYVSRAIRTMLGNAKPGEASLKPITKADLVTQLSRAFVRDLEKLSLAQLEAFKTASTEFKERWLRDQPPAPPDDEEVTPPEVMP